MRVESCGPLFAEPKEGDIFFSSINHRLSEPITSILNPKNNNNNNLLVGEEDGEFLQIDTVVNNNKVAASSDDAVVVIRNETHPLPPVGFFLTEEEWSLFRQPDFGLVKSDTMNHNLPKIPNIHSPLTSLSAYSSSSAADIINQSQEPAPELLSSSKPQQIFCGGDDGYSGICSGGKDDDDEFNNNNNYYNNNNNNIVSKLHNYTAEKVDSGGNPTVPDDDDEYATTPVQGEDAAAAQLNDPFVRPLPLSSNSEYYNDGCNNDMPSFIQDDSSSVLHHRSAFSNFISENEQQEYLSWNLGGNLVSNGGGSFRQIPSSVDTIRSHPQPITSISTVHGHNHIPPHPQQGQHLCHHDNNNPNSQPFAQQQQQAINNMTPRQENWMDEQDSSTNTTQDYFEDWQSQSIFLSSEVDKAKLKWHQNQSQNNNNNNNYVSKDAVGRGGGNNNNNQFMQQQLLLQHQTSFYENGITIAGVVRPSEDTRTLITFLSKFDDKVAAIWGDEGQQQKEDSRLAGGVPGYVANVGFVVGGAVGLPYSESYLSSCSTPVSCNMYPWASPTFNEPNNNDTNNHHHHQQQQAAYRYDIRYMQNQIEQHQLLQESQARHLQLRQQYNDSLYYHHSNGGLGGQEPKMVNFITNNNLSSTLSSNTNTSHSTYGPVRRPSVSRYHAPPGIDPAIIMPPIAKNPLSHEIRKTFGIISSKEVYHIVKAVDKDIPVEEMENSLTQLSHEDECSAFKRFLPPSWLIPDAADENAAATTLNKNNVDNNDDANIGGGDGNHPSELEISTMQAIFGSLDLVGGNGGGSDDDEDSLVDYNLEVTDFLKSKPKTFYEQHFPPADLLFSWTTHFTPIDIIEKINGYDYSSPPGILQPGHENDPNLPEYYSLFAGIEKEYNIFLRPAKTLFPIRFKLCPQPEKSIQTESPQAAKDLSTNEKESHPHDPFRHLTVFDWSSFGYGNNNNNNEDYLSVSSGSRTPFEFKTTTTTTVDDNNINNPLEIQTTDWFLNGRELGSGDDEDGGGLDEYDYDNVAGAFAHSDYCCDSGIGIDGSSRTGFYDDLYPEYEGVEYVGEDGGMALQPYSTAITTATENDVDYGQFQSFSYNTWSTSSASGKATGKHGRRRTKGKPCKYFLADGSCKRGNNCKFSHDFTTCRYWAEGSCLKGDACPYLHCFLEGHNSFGSGGESKERRRAGKRYHLESDNDFPALGDTTTNKMPTTVDMPQLSSSSSLIDGAAGRSSAEGSLLMLADPAGSMYDSYGYGFGLHVSQAAAATAYEDFPLPILQDQQQHQTVTVPFFKTDLKRSGGNGKSAGGGGGTGKSSQSGSSSWTRQQQGNKGTGNNNWIASMISVKEKRKKKKQ